MEQDWLDALPEAYRDPEKLKALAERAPDLEREATQYKDFYEKQYMPWVTEHGTTFKQYQQDADDYRRWKEGGQGTRPTELPPARSAPLADTTPINFDDPDALEHAYHRLENDIGDLRSTYAAEISTLKTALESERTNVYQLIALQEQAYGLLNNDTWTEIGRLKGEETWRPQTDIRAVASYAKDHGLADLAEAHQQLYRTNREKALEQAAYERAKRDVEAQYKNERVTTEMGSGTPLPELRRSRPDGLTRGYGNNNLEAIQRTIAERRAARRMAAS